MWLMVVKHFAPGCKVIDGSCEWNRGLLDFKASILNAITMPYPASSLKDLINLSLQMRGFVVPQINGIGKAGLNNKTFLKLNVKIKQRSSFPKPFTGIKYLVI